MSSLYDIVLVQYHPFMESYSSVHQSLLFLLVDNSSVCFATLVATR